MSNYFAVFLRFSAKSEGIWAQAGPISYIFQPISISVTPI